jgi:hypothetical protein
VRLGAVLLSVLVIGTAGCTRTVVRTVSTTATTDAAATTTAASGQAQALEVRACTALKDLHAGIPDPDPQASIGTDSFNAAQLDPAYEALVTALHSKDGNAFLEQADVCKVSTGIDIRPSSAAQTIPSPSLTPTTELPVPSTLPGGSTTEAEGCHRLNVLGQQFPIPYPVPASEEQQVQMMLADFESSPTTDVGKSFDEGAVTMHTALYGSGYDPNGQRSAGQYLSRLCGELFGPAG